MLLTSDWNQIDGTMSMDPPSSPSLGHQEAVVGAGDDRMRRWTGGTVVVRCPVGGRHVDKEIRDGGRGRERLEISRG